MDVTGIEKVISVLDDMRNTGIIRRYAVGGAFAATLQNEPISTVDVHIFFLLSRGGDETILSLVEIYDYAKQKGFSFDHEFINIYGWLVKFIESSRNDLWKEAVESAKPIRIGDSEVPVIDAEHLIAMWLFAGRAKDYQKKAMFLESGLVGMSLLFDILEHNDLMIKWEQEKWRFANETK